jgi:hypothetical protein
MVETLTNSPSTLTFEHIHALEELVYQKDLGVVDLPDNLVVVKNKAFLEMSHK